VAFEGGKGTDYPLTIGSGSFIPGFEDQLIGAEIGADVEVNVTFPEQYQAAALAGTPAVFKCKVNEIKVKELPEADDEFAQDVSEFETLAEYKDDIRAKLLEKKTAEAKRQKENKAVAKAVENASMEIPDAMVMEQVNRMTDDFKRRIQSQGITYEQYLQFTGATAQQLADQMKPEALKRIQNSLVLEAIAKAEQIEVSEEKLDAEIEKMAAAYKMETAKLKELLGDAEKEQMKSDLAIQAAVEMITEAAVEVEKTEEAAADAE
jgi:trigger factor